MKKIKTHDCQFERFSDSRKKLYRELVEVTLSRDLLLTIFCLVAKETKKQEKPYEIAAHHSLAVFHA